MTTPGRDRLSSLDLVPERAQDDVVWAVRELNKRAKPNVEILAELNAKLADKNVAPISSSAFGRKAVRLKALRQRMEIAREVLAGVDDLTAGDVDDQTVKIGYVIMMLIGELVADGEDRSPKELKAIADAFRGIVMGQKVSADRRQKVETEADRRAAKKTAAAVEKVAREAGLSAAVISQLRTGVLGQSAAPKPAEGAAS